MNNVYIVNLEAVDKYKFNHLTTYHLLFYIMGNYDCVKNRIYLKQKHIIEQLHSNGHSVRNAIDELVNRGIIIHLINYKGYYRVIDKGFKIVDSSDLR